MSFVFSWFPFRIRHQAVKEKRRKVLYGFCAAMLPLTG
jgi:hypothetical protein